VTGGEETKGLGWNGRRSSRWGDECTL